MKRLAFLLLVTSCALALVSAQATGAEGDNDTGHKEKTFTVTKGGALSVSVSAGDIRIRTWDKNEVHVLVTGDDEEDELANVRIRQHDNTVQVEYESDWGNSGDMEFEISIPTQFNVTLETSGGDMSIDGKLTGTLKGETSGGNIGIGGVKGNVDLNTSGGDISTEDVDGDLILNTSGGNIRVGKVTGTAEVGTSGGEISIESTGKSVHAETAGGNVDIGDVKGDAVVVTAGGDISMKNISGGAKLKTAGGNIRVGSANGKVYAKTAGGDVVLEHIVGTVDARTSAGNVDVELVPNGTSKSVLSTSVGDVVLRIGNDSKASIDARVRVQGWWKGSSDEEYIFSDFKEDTYEKSGRDREIRAKYTINGGGQQVSLQSTMGNIRIVKPNGSKSSEKKTSKGKK